MRIVGARNWHKNKATQQAQGHRLNRFRRIMGLWGFKENLHPDPALSRGKRQKFQIYGDVFWNYLGLRRRSGDGQ